MAVLNYSCIVSTSDLSDDYKKLSGVQPQDKTIDLPVIVELIDDENYMAIINKLGLPEKEYMGSNAKLISVAKIEDNKKWQYNCHKLSQSHKTRGKNIF